MVDKQSGVERAGAKIPARIFWNIMAKNKTSKSCFESAYGGGWLSAAQRIAELACERKAGSNGQTLVSYFWKQKYWATIFRAQINMANKLLEEFDVEAIMSALRTKEGKRVYSLGAPFFKTLCQAEQRKLELQRQRIETAIVPETTNTVEPPRPVRRAGRSVRDKLQGL